MIMNTNVYTHVYNIIANNHHLKLLRMLSQIRFSLHRSTHARVYCCCTCTKCIHKVLPMYEENHCSSCKSLTSPGALSPSTSNTDTLIWTSPCADVNHFKHTQSTIWTWQSHRPFQVLLNSDFCAQYLLCIELEHIPHHGRKVPRCSNLYVENCTCTSTCNKMPQCTLVQR